MKKASNIRTWNYPSKGTPIYRDTTEIPPMNSFRAGGYMGEDPPVKDYSTIPGVNKEKLAQWNSLGKEAPTNVQEAQLLAEAVGYNPQQAVIVAAQWALESGQGKKVGGDYNYFGIKSHNQSVRDRMKNAYGIETSAAEKAATSEYEGGKKKSTKASFLNFQNPIEAFLGHKAFLETNARYKKALEKTSPAEFVEALGEAGYATDVNYKNKIASIAKPIIGEEAFGTFSTTSSKELDKYKPKYFTNNSIPVTSDPEEIKKIIEKTDREVSGASTYQPEQFVELESKKNIPIMSLTPGKPAFGQSIFTAGQTFNPPKMATQSNKKAYGGNINLFQNGGGDPPPNFFNFDPTPEYVGYQGRVPVAESTRVVNTYRPTQQEIKATKEYSKKVGDLAQDIKKESNVSQKVAMQQAEQILEANSRIQPEAKAYANTKQAQERDAYVFEEGMNARDYFRYPLQFLAGRTPTAEERIQDRIRITDPRTSNLDKFMGTAGQAMGLAPEALINTGVGLAFAPSRFSKLGQVVDAVSPIGNPTSPFNTRAQNDILVEQARRSGEATLPSYMEPFLLPSKAVRERNPEFFDYMQSVKETFRPINKNTKVRKTDSFKSEIDWAKWNKEIPENKDLMQEYHAIEQQAKANNTWMKNPDGSAFQGTPEQFVQQNSENFKKAFPEGSNISYRGDLSKISEIKSQQELGKEAIKRKYNLNDNDTEALEKLWERSKDKLNSGKYTTNDYDAALKYAKGDKNKVLSLYTDIRNPKFTETGESFRVLEKNRQKLLSEGYDALITKPSSFYPEGENVLLKSNQIKSSIGNNGMFDMTNPNIYKALIPAAIATGAAASSNEYKQGGNLNTFNYQQNMLPLQTITEPQEVELTPEEINYYRSLGYEIEELD